MKQFLTALGIFTVLAPAVTTAVLGFLLLIGKRPKESFTYKLLQYGNSLGLFSAITVFLTMLVTGNRNIVIDLGVWVKVPPKYHFHGELLFDRLSIPFAILTYVLCGTIGSFASRYMHRENGYQRFFLLFALFNLGMILAAVSGSVETLFTGWELVGLSSVLLIGFFHERQSPVQNGFRVWVVYRISDAALLLAAMLTHKLVGEGDFHKLLGEGEWPYGTTTVNTLHATLIGGLLLVAAAGKSAMVPFSGWLPRAMEGPTPSSAVFYGALSVHLGVFLLLRVSPLLAQSLILSLLTIAIGFTTTVFATVIGKVQTDIKSVLSYAALTQVGLMVCEIGFGYWIPFFWYVALVHLLGHACLRTLQFVRAPSLLLDYRTLENATGQKLPRTSNGNNSRFRLALYHFALERGHLDALLNKYFARPFLSMFQKLSAWEKRWTDKLNRTDAEDSPVVEVGPSGRKEQPPLSFPHSPQPPSELSSSGVLP